MGLLSPGELSLERRLMELRIAERGEGCGAAQHRRYEALLAYDNVRGVPIAGFAGEVQRQLRLAPHQVEWVASQEKVRNGRGHTKVSVDANQGLTSGPFTDECNGSVK